jgi:hypothetical protein
MYPKHKTVVLCTSPQHEKKVLFPFFSFQRSNGEPCFSCISGGRSISAMSTCTISLAMSSTENGMLKSSSSRKELMSSCTDGLLDPPIILARMLETTSDGMPRVPYLSSQYIVLIRYSCCMLSAGQKSSVISLRDFLCLSSSIRRVTACRIFFSSSQEEPAYSSVSQWHQCSNSSSPALTYSPLLNEQHSRRSRRLLNSCTLMNENTWVNNLHIRNGGTCKCNRKEREIRPVSNNNVTQWYSF